MAFAPTPAHAAGKHGDSWGGMDHPMMGGFWIMGDVTAVAADSISVRLPDREYAPDFMRNISIEVTLAVVDDSILLGNDLSVIAATDLQEGDEVVVVPSLVWGNLTARMIFVGAPSDLPDYAYRGRLIGETENMLMLESRSTTYEVTVDDATIWYEGGRVERPAELAPDLRLQVWGVEQEDGTIHAVLVTSATHGF
jgi:hypothetical protein